MDYNNTNEGIYFYHADHLGSSSVVTSKTGEFHEHIEYFPYGETWVEENKGGINLPYKYTSKEFDPETNLYYFGARYYDAKLSRWISVDPPLVSGEYLPKPSDFDTDHNYLWHNSHDETHKIPGMGGVFNPVNLNAYHYAGLNPVRFVDPDGNSGEIVYGTAVAISGLVGGGYALYQVYQALGDKATKSDYLAAGTFGALTGMAIFTSGTLLVAGKLMATAFAGGLYSIVMQRIQSQGKETTKWDKVTINMVAALIMMGKGDLIKKNLNDQAAKDVVSAMTEVFNTGGSAALTDFAEKKFESYIRNKK